MHLPCSLHMKSALTQYRYIKQWVLTEEDVLEPPALLKKALQRKNLPETGVFDVCYIGESREF